MYNNISISTKKLNSRKNYKEGFVRISLDTININPFAYKKREKIIKNGN